MRDPEVAARGRRPVIVPDPPPRHAVRRRRTLRALRAGDPDAAVTWVDRADAATPDVGGHLDGQEFHGLRDADDRFASVLEVILAGDYAWVPWEALRAVALDPPRYALDRLFRPARLTFADGTTLTNPSIDQVKAQLGKHTEA